MLGGRYYPMGVFTPVYPNHIEDSLLNKKSFRNVQNEQIICVQVVETRIIDGAMI